MGLVVLNMVRRATAKSGSHSLAAATLNGLPDERRKMLLDLGQLALNGLKREKGCYVFDMEKVRSVCGDAAESLGFLEEFRTRSERGEWHEVQFCHLTYQEFLAAYFVSNADDVESELESCGEALGLGEETAPFWQFFGGLLGRENVELLMQFLSRSEATMAERWGASKRLLLRMSCFSEALEQPCSVEELDQYRDNVDRAAWDCLQYKVDLSDLHLGMSDIHAVAVSLAHSKYFTDLNLSSTKLDSERIRALCTAGGMQRARRLYVGSNERLHGEGLTTLANAFAKHGRLLAIDISYCRLDADDCAALKTILTTNKKLENLFLSGNLLSTDALESLQSELASSQLCGLRLKRTSMDADGASILGKILKENPYLQDVRLDRNLIGNSGATSVLKGARSAKALARISMIKANIDDGVMPALTKMLQKRVLACSADRQSDSSMASLDVCLHGNRIRHYSTGAACKPNAPWCSRSHHVRAPCRWERGDHYQRPFRRIQQVCQAREQGWPAVEWYGDRQGRRETHHCARRAWLFSRRGIASRHEHHWWWRCCVARRVTPYQLHSPCSVAQRQQHQRPRLHRTDRRPGSVQHSVPAMAAAVQKSHFWEWRAPEPRKAGGTSGEEHPSEVPWSGA